MRTDSPHKSSLGNIAANLVAMVCYLCLLVFWSLAPVVLLVVFFCEKKSLLVRFHAMQAMLLWLVRTLVGADIPFEGLAAVLTGSSSYLMDPLGWAGSVALIGVRVVLSLGVLALAALCAVNAYYWRMFKLPLLGQLAFAICGKAMPEEAPRDAGPNAQASSAQAGEAARPERPLLRAAPPPPPEPEVPKASAAGAGLGTGVQDAETA
ncbi:MAG: hypothetical protein AB7V55_07095, partial [Oscillospiraceae bacterium]